MGFVNHELFFKMHRHLFRGPFLEIGAKDYGSTTDFRKLLPGEEYVGIDMEAGKGVDLVLDLTLPFAEVDAALGGRRFGSILCLSVMEHCARPFAMAENITRLLRPGGVLYVSVPHAWQFHGYPSDFWRFTPEGVKVLFPGLEFDMSLARACTDVEGDFQEVDQDLRRIRFKGSWHRRRGGLLRGFSADLLAMMGWLGPLRWLTRHRYVMPPTCIEMIGVLRPADPQSDGQTTT